MGFVQIKKPSLIKLQHRDEVYPQSLTYDLRQLLLTFVVRVRIQHLAK